MTNANGELVVWRHADCHCSMGTESSSSRRFDYPEASTEGQAFVLVMGHNQRIGLMTAYDHSAALTAKLITLPETKGSN